VEKNDLDTFRSLIKFANDNNIIIKINNDNKNDIPEEFLNIINKYENGIIFIDNDGTFLT